MIEWLKKPWPYWVGGILLGILNVILLAITGTTWHITTGFVTWSVGILELIGIDISKWGFFEIFNYVYGDIIKNHNLFINKYTVLNIGVIMGALIATLLSSQFKLRKIKDKKRIIVSLVGGIIMGYGARITSGCNIGRGFHLFLYMLGYTGFLLF